MASVGDNLSRQLRLKVEAGAIERARQLSGEDATSVASAVPEQFVISLNGLKLLIARSPAETFEDLLSWHRQGVKNQSDRKQSQTLALERTLCEMITVLLQPLPDPELPPTVASQLEASAFNILLFANAQHPVVGGGGTERENGVGNANGPFDWARNDAAHRGAMLLGVLATIPSRFEAVTRRCLAELTLRLRTSDGQRDNTLARGDLLALVYEMRFLNLRGAFAFSLPALTAFLIAAFPLKFTAVKKKSELHHALCLSLAEMLRPLVNECGGLIPPSARNDDSSVKYWHDQVNTLRLELSAWMAKDSKHLAFGYPLQTMLICLASTETFASLFTPMVQGLKKYVRDRKLGVVVVSCLSTILMAYAQRRAARSFDALAENAIQQLRKTAEDVTKELVSVIKRNGVSGDSRAFFVDACIQMFKNDGAWILREVVVPLLKQDYPSEAAFCGIVLLTKLVYHGKGAEESEDHQAERGSNFPADEASSLETLAPAIPKCLGTILKSCNREFGGSLMVSGSSSDGPSTENPTNATAYQIFVHILRLSPLFIPDQWDMKGRDSRIGDQLPKYLLSNNRGIRLEARGAMTSFITHRIEYRDKLFTGLANRIMSLSHESAEFTHEQTLYLIQLVELAMRKGACDIDPATVWEVQAVGMVLICHPVMTLRSSAFKVLNLARALVEMNERKLQGNDSSIQFVQTPFILHLEAASSWLQSSPPLHDMEPWEACEMTTMETLIEACSDDRKSSVPQSAWVRCLVAAFSYYLHQFRGTDIKYDTRALEEIERLYRSTAATISSMTSGNTYINGEGKRLFLFSVSGSVLVSCSSKDTMKSVTAIGRAAAGAGLELTLETTSTILSFCHENLYDAFADEMTNVFNECNEIMRRGGRGAQKGRLRADELRMWVSTSCREIAAKCWRVGEKPPPLRWFVEECSKFCANVEHDVHEWDSLKRSFCIVIRSILINQPISKRNVLPPNQRATLFKQIMKWSLSESADRRNGESVSTIPEMPSALNLSADWALASLLSGTEQEIGDICFPSGQAMEWLADLLSQQRDKKHRNRSRLRAANMGLSQLLRLRPSEFTKLLIDKSYGEGLEASGEYFKCVSNYCLAQSSISDIPVWIGLGIYHTAHNRNIVRESALRLLDCLIDYNHASKLSLLSTYSSLTLNATASTCSLFQRKLALYLAAEHPEFAAPLCCDLLRRLVATRDYGVRQPIMNCLVPWLEQVVLTSVDDEVLELVSNVTLENGYNSAMNAEAIWCTLAARSTNVTLILDYLLQGDGKAGKETEAAVYVTRVAPLVATEYLVSALGGFLDVPDANLIDASGNSVNRASRALSCIVALAHERDEELRCHLPTLLHLSVTILEDESDVAAHARSLLAVIVCQLGARQLELCGNALAGNGAIRLKDDIDTALEYLFGMSEEAADGPLCQHYTVLVEKLVCCLSFTEGDLGRRWADTALQWALTCKSTKLAVRSHRILRVLKPAAAAVMTPEACTALIRTLSSHLGQPDGFQARILESLKTLSTIVESSSSDRLLLQPQLFWAAIALLSSTIPSVFAAAASLFCSLLRQLPLEDDIAVPILIVAILPENGGDAERKLQGCGVKADAEIGISLRRRLARKEMERPALIAVVQLVLTPCPPLFGDAREALILTLAAILPWLGSTAERKLRVDVASSMAACCYEHGLDSLGAVLEEEAESSQELSSTSSFFVAIGPLLYEHARHGLFFSKIMRSWVDMLGHEMRQAAALDLINIFLTEASREDTRHLVETIGGLSWELLDLPLKTAFAAVEQLMDMEIKKDSRNLIEKEGGAKGGEEEEEQREAVEALEVVIQRVCKSRQRIVI